MLFLGRPRIEYICPYGHGTLKLAELQISGLENPEWNPHGEIWDELCASARDADRHRDRIAFAPGSRRGRAGRFWCFWASG